MIDTDSIMVDARRAMQQHCRQSKTLLVSPHWETDIANVACTWCFSIILNWTSDIALLMHRTSVVRPYVLSPVSVGRNEREPPAQEHSSTEQASRLAVATNVDEIGFALQPSTEHAACPYFATSTPITPSWMTIWAVGSHAFSRVRLVKPGEWACNSGFD